MDTQSRAQLQLLVDKQAIAELLYRYCHACDHRDEAALRSCFHADASHDHAGYTGPTAAWFPAALHWLHNRVAITHMIANPLIRIDGDRALSDCHFIAYNRLAKPNDLVEEVLVKGRYIDRLVRAPGGWLIMHRLGIHDLELIRDIPATERPMAAGHASGDPSHDPYFKLLAEFPASA